MMTHLFTWGSGPHGGRLHSNVQVAPIALQQVVKDGLSQHRPAHMSIFTVKIKQNLAFKV